MKNETHVFNQVSGPQSIGTQNNIINNNGCVSVPVNQENDWVIDCIGKNGYKRILDNLDRISAVIESESIPDKDEIIIGVREAEEAAKNRDASSIKKALSKIAKLGEAILTKASASILVELLKELKIGPFA